MKDRTETSVEELVEQCKKLERKQEEKEDSINKMLSFEEEHALETRLKIRQLVHEEQDCLGDNKLLNLIDEKRTILKKIERQHDAIHSSLRKELKDSQEESVRSIVNIRKQINEMQ